MAQEDSKPRSSSVLLELSDSEITRTLLLRETIAKESAAVNSDALRADYETTVEMVKLLTDIRFRCLVFVTAIIAIANALMPNTALPGTKIAFGLVGFFTTLGIAVYELRNTQLHQSALDRAKVLEVELEVEKTSSKAVPGLFNKEDGQELRPMRFVFVPVQHREGLALIYGAVLGGWFYLIVYGVVSSMIETGLWPFRREHVPGVFAGALAFLVFAFARRRFVRSL